MLLTCVTLCVETSKRNPPVSEMAEYQGNSMGIEEPAGDPGGEPEAPMEPAILARFVGDKDVRPAPDTRYRFVTHAPEGGPAQRPVVIGAGPEALRRYSNGRYDLGDYTIERLVELTGMNVKVIRGVPADHRGPKNV